jgi:hypothetical protein
LREVIREYDKTYGLLKFALRGEDMAPSRRLEMKRVALNCILLKVVG